MPINQLQATGTDYKLPKSVLVVIYTRDGEVLMLRRTQPDWFWQSVTGSLKASETPRQAAVREVFEETGLRTYGRLVEAHHSERFPIVTPWRKRYAPGVGFNREYWFYLVLPERRKIRLHVHEHAQYCWLPALQAAHRASSWTNRKAIRWLLAGETRKLGDGFSPR